MTERKTVVAVLSRVEPRHLEQIMAVDPRIEVRDLSSNLRTELASAGSSLYRGKQPGDMTPEEARRKLDEGLKDAEIIYSFQLPPDLLRRAPRLRWLQNAGAGVEHLAGTGLPNDRVTVTNVSGIAAVPIAEHVFWFMLMFSRQGTRLIENRRLKRWERFQATELQGKTLGVIGLGHIGAQVAALGKAFGMEVLATRRSAARRQRSVQGVDELFPPSELKQILGASDFVVLSLPLTGETTRMIGEAELRAMKPTSYLINISRGSVIDEPALVTALKERWIAGAGLDVFHTEPLPASSELWQIENAIISPHIAGVSEKYNDRAVAFFCDNLKRYLGKQNLVNIVDVTAGY